MSVDIDALGEATGRLGDQSSTAGVDGAEFNVKYLRDAGWTDEAIEAVQAAADFVATAEGFSLGEAFIAGTVLGVEVQQPAVA